MTMESYPFGIENDDDLVESNTLTSSINSIENDGQMNAKDGVKFSRSSSFGITILAKNLSPFFASNL